MQLLFIDNNLRAGEVSDFSLLIEQQKMYLFNISCLVRPARHPRSTVGKTCCDQGWTWDVPRLGTLRLQHIQVLATNETVF